MTKIYQPAHFVSKDGAYHKANRQFVGVNDGWKEVDYRWVGHKGKWYLQYQKDEVSQAVTLENARYWEGTKYRGDMAYFGNGLQELPDPVNIGAPVNGTWFKGSLYKFHSSIYDVTENYAAFMPCSYKDGSTTVDAELGQAGYQNPFAVEGALKFARLGGAKGAYVRTVTKPGLEGHNWGCGAFFGTSSANIFANRSALVFRIPSSSNMPENKGAWLWFAGSETQDDELYGPAWAGLYALGNGEIRYIRKSYIDGLIVIKIDNAYELDEWCCIEWGHNKAHNQWFFSINPKSDNERTVSSTASSIMLGAQFDDVLFGAGPNLNASDNTITDGLLSRASRYEVHIMRFFTETTESGFNDVAAPLWWKVPKFRLFANLHTVDGEEVDITKWVINLPISQTNDVFYAQCPADLNAELWWISYEGNFGRSNKLPFRTTRGDERKTELFCDFTDRAEIEQHFLIAEKQWGGTGVVGANVVLLNGGVVAKNVEVYPNYTNQEDDVNGVVRFYANGQFYSGDISGVDRKGNPTARKTEVGACIASRQYLGAGSFRMKVRGMRNDGACNCCWTFHYEEIYENDQRWNEFTEYGDDGLHAQFDSDGGAYLVRNNEIDIEWPTAHKGTANMELVRQDSARLNSWQGETRNWDLENDPTNPDYWSEYTDDFVKVIEGGLNDGQWHEIGFDWHIDAPNPSDDSPAKRVDFYVDGKIVQTTKTHIPDIAGRFWIGVWFPRARGNRWAGAYTNYERDSLDIDWVRWVPFHERGAREVSETYPNDVWRDWNDDNFKLDVVDELPPHVVMPNPVNDLLTKDNNGNFVSTIFRVAGTNPADYVGQNRLEWRTDIAGRPAGMAGDVFFEIGKSMNVSFRIDFKEVTIKGSGLELLTYDSSVGSSGIVKLDCIAGSSQIVKFKTNTAGRIVIRRVASARNFTGIADVYLEQA